ncbi:hypothetical protein Bandiella_01578 (plasmid) [Candidatus Bandiella woodruffii]|uniref:Uncharacterized protein n=1 Tax=Candidatus Bandiella euplotis TaxID=1664265 RepID=A0ABZ0UQW3_9RICK|nr:hypothetical protein Bandiella_01578 [Candidatus Bandiella woodruffii]
MLYMTPNVRTWMNDKRDLAYMDFTFATGGYFLLRVNGQSAVLNMIESFGGFCRIC